MSGPAMIGHLVLEKLAHRPLPRIPESELIMQAEHQVAAFADSGRDQGMLAYLYLFHAVMALPVIRPGDTVLDLACGPANQLMQIARLNPDARFIGIDASRSMLTAARAAIDHDPPGNIDLRQADMTFLEGFSPHSVDSVLCTMSLHHLADPPALIRCLGQIRRVLKPGGGLYLADFGRLKRRSTQRYFAYDRQSSQSEQFTADFLQSMQAAFSLQELHEAVTANGLSASCYSTAMAPFMVVMRSSARRTCEASVKQRARQAFAALTPRQQRDIDNLVRWFALGGLRLPFALA